MENNIVTKQNRTVILTRGIQGSGKSTWTKKWVAEKPNVRLRWNSDDIRNMLGPYNVEEWKIRENFVNNMFKSWLRQALDNGYDIVIDNMNLSDSAVSRVMSIVNEYNDGKLTDKDYKYQYIVEFKDFFTPVDECIRRDAMRPNPIGEQVIKQTWRRYRSKILKLATQSYVDNMMLYHTLQQHLTNTCIIADMDSTICFNTTGRPYYGQGAADEMMLDIPNASVISLIQQYLNSASDEDRVFIITGRDATPEVMQATQDYVDTYVSKDKRIVILYRTPGDYCSGPEMKLKLIDNNIWDRYYIQYAIDDSSKVVEAYRQRGITVLQPNQI